MQDGYRPPESAVSGRLSTRHILKILIWQAHVEQIHAEDMSQKRTLVKMSIGKTVFKQFVIIFEQPCTQTREIHTFVWLLNKQIISHFGRHILMCTLRWQVKNQLVETWVGLLPLIYAIYM